MHYCARTTESPFCPYRMRLANEQRSTVAEGFVALISMPSPLSFLVSGWLYFQSRRCSPRSRLADRAATAQTAGLEWNRESGQRRKRQRTGSLHTIEFMAVALPTAQDAADGHEVPSMDEQAHDVLRRSLVLALRQVGFASATRDALEVFTDDGRDM